MKIYSVMQEGRGGKLYPVSNWPTPEAAEREAERCSKQTLGSYHVMQIVSTWKDGKRQ